MSTMWDYRDSAWTDGFDLAGYDVQATDGSIGSVAAATNEVSNAYLVADPEAKTGVLIDGNDELAPLLEKAEREGIEITHILVTHPHGDHIAGLEEAREKLGNPPVVAHAATAAEIDLPVDVTLNDGDVFDAGPLEIKALFTPGHAAGNNTIGDIAHAPAGWSLTTSAVCSSEVAAVPLVGDMVADHSTTCAEAQQSR